MIRRALSAALLVLLPLAGPARGGEGGAWSVGVSVGSGSTYGSTYLVLGARVGYEFLPRLVLDVDGQYWAGGSPPIGKLAPGVTWHTPYRLYLGPYYAHWFVGSGQPDQDALGARAGLTLASYGAAVFAVGAAYEHTLGCRTSCDAVWPEASVSVRF